MKYKMKLYAVDAVQWLSTTESFEAIKAMGLKDSDWEPGEMGSKSFIIKKSKDSAHGLISSREVVRYGMWVIKDDEGEFFVCRDDTFQDIYEPLEDTRPTLPEQRPEDMGEVVAQWLEDNGYDGLYSDCGDCGCTLPDLYPCGDLSLHCQPGYRAPCDCGDHDWHIVAKKPTKEGE